MFLLLVNFSAGFCFMAKHLAMEAFLTQGFTCLQESEAPSAAPAPPPADVRRPWEKQNTGSPAQVNGSQSQSPKPVRK